MIGWSTLSKLQKKLLAIKLGILIFEVHMRSEDKFTRAWGPLSFSLMISEAVLFFSQIYDVAQVVIIH
jgi:hypothetical protein